MIYSTDYAELYRRVQNEEEVLCLVPEGIRNRPAIAFLMSGVVNVTSPGVIWFSDIETESEFIAACKKNALRFVPDNEGLVKAARELVDSIDRHEHHDPYFFPNHTRGKSDDLAAALKPYENE